MATLPLTIYANANIITMNAKQPRAEAMAVSDGRVLAIGSYDDVAPIAEMGSHWVDLEGRTVIPGFNDCHMHILSFGLTLEQVDLSSVTMHSIADVRRRVAGRATDTPDGKWLTGRGYNHDRLLERRHPTRSDLDEVSDVLPIVLFHASGHILTCNSRALELAGIDVNMTAPVGGEIEHDVKGQPTGVLKETAMELLVRSLPPPTLNEAREAIIRAMDVMTREGITSASDASTGHEQPVDREIAAYRAAQQSGRLNGRITLMPHIRYVAPPDSDAVLLPSDFGVGGQPEWMRIGATKIFSDGAFTTRTGALRTQYRDVDSLGLLTWEHRTLTSMVTRAHSAGWQIATHAMGDLAIEHVLDAYEAAAHTSARSDTRHRIEHCSLPDMALTARIKAQGVVAVVQPGLISQFGDSYIAGLGIDRAADAMPMHWFQELAVPVAFSSDRPVIPGAPLAGIRAAMERETPEGQVLGHRHCVTAQQAIRHYTIGSAYATFSENDKGALAPGFQADFLALNHDITRTAAEELVGVHVMMTVVGGHVVYQR